MKMILKVIAVLLIGAMLTTCAFAEEAQLESMLVNLVDEIRPGSAGCSLRAIKCAADLMKWGMTTKMTTEEITNTVKAVEAGAPSKDEFDEAMEEMYSAYCSLLTDEGTTLMQDAGCDPAVYDFSEIESIEAVEDIMAAIGADN